MKEGKRHGGRLVKFVLSIKQQMTQKGAGVGGNMLRLRALGREAKVPEVGVNFDELARPGLARTIVPTFNRDRLFFTPAFVLPADQKYYAQNTTFEKFSFKEKVERTLNLLDQKHFPDTVRCPAPNSNYCQVCRTPFDDYFAHLAHQDHISATRSNPVNKHIQELEKAFSKKNTPPPKTKGIRKGLRSSKTGSGPSIARKEESIQEGSECFPRSLNQSTAVRGKDDLSGVV